MRVIAGQFRSRRIKSLRGLNVRPTPGRLREALFNVLSPRLEGCTFIDAYAGCGSVGIEALSRGAAQVVFIDKRRTAAAVIRENLSSLDVTSGFEVRCSKASTELRRVTGDIIFLDPPYDQEREYDIALGILGDAPPDLAIAQHTSRHALKEHYGRLRRTRVLRHGSNSLSFFEADRP